MALDLSDADDIVEAVGTMRTHLGDDAVATVMVQEMVSPGVNVRIRATADPRLGPVISVGLGGLHADAIGDSVSRLAPLSGAAAAAMVARARAGLALDDEAEHRTAEVLVRVAQLVSDHPEIVHLDLNPVIVADRAVSVVDARVTVAPAGRDEPPLRRL